MSELGVTRSASFTSVTTNHTEDSNASSSTSRKGKRKWWKRYVTDHHRPSNDTNTLNTSSPSFTNSPTPSFTFLLFPTILPETKQICTAKTCRLATHLCRTPRPTLLHHHRLHLPGPGHCHCHCCPKHSLLQSRIRHGCTSIPRQDSCRS